MTTRTLDDVFIHELRELYDAEHELVKILADLARDVQDARAAQLLNTLRCETRNHVFGLEQILSTLGHVPRRGKCRWLRGLAEGYNAFLRTKPSRAALDAYDLMFAFKAIRAVIAFYRVLITMALRLDHPGIVDPLRQHLWDVEGDAERLQAQLGRTDAPATNHWTGVGHASAMAVSRPPASAPATFAAATRLPPDSPEDRENVLAGGQETM
jgi:ferritin-like metal-binding protein YciE